MVFDLIKFHNELSSLLNPTPTLVIAVEAWFKIWAIKTRAAI